MSAKLPRILAAQYRKALKEDNPNLLVHMNPANAREWTFMLLNLPAPYQGGEYLFQLVAPARYPEKPPSFKFLTPNGIFTPGGKICISIGEFHAEDRAGATGAYGWRRGLGMVGFAREGGVNGFLIPESLGGGIRVCQKSTTAADRATFARESVEYNAANFAELVHAFDEMCADHPTLAAVRGRKMRQALAAVPRPVTVLGSPVLPIIRDALGAECWEILGAELPLHYRHAAGAGRFPGDGAHLLAVMDAVDAPDARRVLAALLALRLARAVPPAASTPGCARRAKNAAALVAERLPSLCGRHAALAERVVDAVVDGDGAGLTAVHAPLEAFLLAEDPAARDTRKPRLERALDRLGGGGGGGAAPAIPAPADGAVVAGAAGGAENADEAAAEAAAAEAAATAAVAEETRRAMEAADLALAHRLAAQLNGTD